MLRYCIIISCLWWLGGTLHAQNITKAEYFIDDHTAVKTINLDATGDDIEQSFSVDLEGVPDGLHILGVKVQDENGQWSVPTMRTFLVQNTPDLPNIVKAEYIIDDGEPVAISGLTAGTDITLSSFNVALDTIAPGLHFLQVRVQDALQNWSVVSVRTFLVNDNKELENITALKYYYVKGEEVVGEGEYSYNIPEPAPSIETDFQATTEPLTDGEQYLLYIWAETESGERSLVNIKSFIYNEVSFELVLTPTHVNCSGENSGIIKATASKGKEPYMYKLDNNEYQESGNFPDLAAGKYFITAKDSEGNEVKDSVVITAPDEIAIIATPANATCKGVEDGSISVSATGGTGKFLYKMGEGEYQEQGTFTGKLAGEYKVYAKDEKGCVQETTTTIGNTRDGLAEIPVVIQEGDNNSLESTLIVTNASGLDYSIRWFKDGDMIEEGPDESLELTEAGDYHAVFYNEIGCVSDPGEIKEITGLEDLLEATTKVYPVPASDFVKVEVPYRKAGNVTAQLINTNGQVLQRKTAKPAGNSVEAEFETASLPDGLYIILLQGDEFNVIKKIQKTSW